MRLGSLFSPSSAAPAGKPSPSEPVIADPLGVIPMIPDDVETRRDSRGMLHLRRPEKPAGFRGKIAEWLHYDYTRRIELDAYGTRYFSLVDGAHTLRAIIDQMIDGSGKNREEVEQATVLFTKKLMTLNLIQLKVPAEAQARRTP